MPPYTCVPPLIAKGPRSGNGGTAPTKNSADLEIAGIKESRRFSALRDPQAHMNEAGVYKISNGSFPSFAFTYPLCIPAV